MNPLSYLLSKEDRIKLTIGDQIRIISHLFFVDDLKLFASSLARMEKPLDIVTQFTNDVGMTFGETKCAYHAIERGKKTEYNQPPKMNGLTVKEIENGDHYTYLGMDESIGILGPLNKDRVKKEYKTRLNKIWQSELNGRSKSNKQLAPTAILSACRRIYHVNTRTRTGYKGDKKETRKESGKEE